MQSRETYIRLAEAALNKADLCLSRSETGNVANALAAQAGAQIATAYLELAAMTTTGRPTMSRGSGVGGYGE
ncbi:MAG: hypothetical protein WC824_12405 [Bacteroidota bacterium]|jgi:hypothetical protein